MSEKPKISIITPSKNTGRFVRETIESIRAQTYENWEHIVIDGVSTDGTLDILRKYPHLRWISEEDGKDDPFKKGFAMARGEYVMFCAFSDGYLDKNWFKKCVEVLDSQREISLVWGIDQNMLENGTLYSIDCNSWFENPPPDEKDYIYHWLKTCKLFHERDFCVRKNIVNECYPSSGSWTSGFRTFAYNFNTLGYLPHLIQTVAAYGRQHRDALSRKDAINGDEERSGRKYYSDVKKYGEKIVKGEIEHRYRDGSGNILPDKFNLKEFLELNNESKFDKVIKGLIPPIFIWFKNKLLARYRVYKNMKKIREDLTNHMKGVK